MFMFFLSVLAPLKGDLLHLDLAADTHRKNKNATIAVMSPSSSFTSQKRKLLRAGSKCAKITKITLRLRSRSRRSCAGSARPHRVVFLAAPSKKEYIQAPPQRPRLLRLQQFQRHEVVREFVWRFPQHLLFLLVYFLLCVSALHCELHLFFPQFLAHAFVPQQKFLAHSGRRGGLFRKCRMFLVELDDVVLGLRELHLQRFHQVRRSELLLVQKVLQERGVPKRSQHAGRAVLQRPARSVGVDRRYRRYGQRRERRRGWIFLRGLEDISAAQVELPVSDGEKLWLEPGEPVGHTTQQILSESVPEM
mmetsp:Transcript_22459/g.56764  ORF Transcript_22459/g.56764 Transcript_22459/m.56764 type:complete len:306 (-) Transcript_22459:821-1738(-)